MSALRCRANLDDPVIMSAAAGTAAVLGMMAFVFSGPDLPPVHR
jgi:hypothetical protein